MRKLFKTERVSDSMGENTGWIAVSTLQNETIEGWALVNGHVWPEVVRAFIDHKGERKFQFFSTLGDREGLNAEYLGGVTHVCPLELPDPPSEISIPAIGDPYPYPMEFTPQCPHLAWLCDHLDGWQFGEQGLIEALAETLGLMHGLCMEYGAGDGVSLPLTIERLCKDDPERCLLVEIDAARRRSLSELYPDAVVASSETWNPKEWDCPAEIVVIDIDGPDSVVMRQMLAARVRPALLVVEHMDRHFPVASSSPKLIPQWLLGQMLSSGNAIQDTAETLHAIASEAGYERIGFNRCNSFFVRRELFGKLFR